MLLKTFDFSVFVVPIFFQLRSYLRQMDAVDEMLLWFRICNIVTSTLATQAPSVPKCRSCFEVFGFDILIDEQMKPWLLEVGANNSGYFVRLYWQSPAVCLIVYTNKKNVRQYII